MITRRHYEAGSGSEGISAGLSFCRHRKGVFEPGEFIPLPLGIVTVATDQTLQKMCFMERLLRNNNVRIDISSFADNELRPQIEFLVAFDGGDDADYFIMLSNEYEHFISMY